MKNIIISVIVMTLLYGCHNNKNNQSDKMRRFTFASYNNSQDSLLFEQLFSDTNAMLKLKANGLINLQYYFFDTISYVIFDVEEASNYSVLSESISEDAHNFAKAIKVFQAVDSKYTLLDRIYKMEQKKIYSSVEGQLLSIQKQDYSRFVLTLEIINDSILRNEYIAIHGIGKAWPEITKNMKTVGIHEMELYINKYRAFLIMDTKPNFDWETDGENWGTLPREKEWQAYVARYQKTNTESKAAEKWRNMNSISMK